MARISTHVLDTARGKPAEGVAVRLYRGLDQVCSTKTNADGRAGLLQDDEIPVGAYDLVFEAGDYLRVVPPFYNVITICFQVTDPFGNYHVPLLLAPYGYSTYRGS